MNRLAIVSVDVEDLLDVLHDAAPRESGAFFLLREGRGVRGRRLLAADPVFPAGGAWERQAEGQLRPGARWISSAVSKAVEQRTGLLFVHSHPDPLHPIGFSSVDVSSMLSLGATIGPILEGPFAAAVVHPEGWAGALVDEEQLSPIERIVSVGRTLQILTSIEAVDRRRPSGVPGLDERQRDALGTVHDTLQQLDVAVVGVGGVGSPAAEQLVRMGTRSLTLIDGDELDTPSNVRRVIGSTPRDLGATRPRRKVDVVGDHLDLLGLGVPVRRVFGDVRDEPVWRELLDVDVVLGCTDTHGSRAALNDLAGAYILPTIDVGTKAGTRRNADLAALVAEVSVVTPVTPCLWCRDRISAEVIRAENLPPPQREQLVREGYLLGGVGEPAPSVMALTALGAALASCALLAMLSSEGEVCPSGYWIDGLMGDSGGAPPDEPLPSCRCRARIAAGDVPG
jgi:molybdopterin/thiamine biosynthesis adenylyltransferase